MYNLLLLFKYLNNRLKVSFLIIATIALLSAIFDLIMVLSLATFFNFFTNENTSGRNILEKIIGKEYEKLYMADIEFYTFSAIVISLSLKITFITISQLFTSKIGTFFSVSIFNRFMQLNYKIIELESNARLIALLNNKVTSVSTGTFFPVFNILGQFINFIVLIVGSLMVYPKIMISLLSILIPTYVLLYLFTNNFKKRLSNDIAKNLQSMAIIANNSIAQSAHIKLRKIYTLFEQKVIKVDESIRGANAKILILATIPRYFLEALAFCLFLFLYSRQDTLSYSLNLSSLIFVALMFQRILPCIQQIYTSLTTIKAHSASVLDVIEVLSPNNADIDFIIENKFFRNCKNTIVNKILVKKLIHKNFINHNTNGLSFTIKKSDRILLVGQSGIGKSTILKLLSGLYEVESGIISYHILCGSKQQIINNHDIRNFVNYEIQNNNAFEGSLYENLTLNCIENIKEEEIAEACEIVELLHLFKVNSRSVSAKKVSSLSGGEKQRLAIARAILSKKPILFFDETTSGINSEMERRILSRIFERFPNTIFIIVSHRNDNADLFTKILDLNDLKEVK